MRRYLTYIFTLLAVISLFLIYRIEFTFSGIIASLIASVCLVFAIYFAKYIK